MSQLAVHARFVATSGRGPELRDAVEAMAQAAAEEPGTLVYAVHRDRDQPDAVVMYELYASDEALDAHGSTDAARRFGEVLGDLLAEEPGVWFSRPWQVKGIPAAEPIG